MAATKKSCWIEGKTALRDFICQGTMRTEGREIISQDIACYREAVPQKRLERLSEGNKGLKKTLQ